MFWERISGFLIVFFFLTWICFFSFCSNFWNFISSSGLFGIIMFLDFWSLLLFLFLFSLILVPVKKVLSSILFFLIGIFKSVLTFFSTKFLWLSLILFFSNSELFTLKLFWTKFFVLFSFSFSFLWILFLLIWLSLL